MRFVYCAASICTFIDSFDGIDTDKMVEYILKSQTYEGAFGQSPGLEAHGGSTYCALAALSMLGKLENLDKRVKGQLIFKFLYGVFMSAKKNNKIFKDFCPSLLKEVGSKK